jgi:hypothetical protein
MGTFGATRIITPGNAVIAHDDLEAAASSAAVLLAPLTYTGSAAHVVLFHPDVRKFAIRARGIFTVRAADPVVCAYLLYYADANAPRIQVGDTSIPSDGSIITRRVYSFASATTITLSCVVATTEQDGTYKYSPSSVAPFQTMQGDTEGSFTEEFCPVNKAFGMLVLTSTAGSVTGSIEAQVIAV